MGSVVNGTRISGPSGAQQGLSRQGTRLRNQWAASDDANERRRINRQFKKLTGKNVSDYITRR